MHIPRLNCPQAIVIGYAWLNDHAKQHDEICTKDINAMSKSLVLLASNYCNRSNYYLSIYFIPCIFVHNVYFNSDLWYYTEYKLHTIRQF